VGQILDQLLGIASVLNSALFLSSFDGRWLLSKLENSLLEDDIFLDDCS
jgi:hypothetical protein